MKNTNINTVQKYFDSLAKGDLETLGSLFSDDIVWHQPGRGKLSKTYKGKSEVFGLFGQFMEISQGSFKIDSVGGLMSNENLVTATLHFSAKKLNGQSISIGGVDLMKVENEKITEVYLFSADQEAEDKFWA
ncbi:MAG: nuclear transport factor 2 family protein [Bdellovibrionaceae bacterium]|nr:nuclear transport factor 2 family protein [Pseudobdellovibrionaceae bacterium]